MAKAVDGRNSVARAVKSTIYEELREALTKPVGKSKKSWSQDFIEKLLLDAKQNPNSPVGQIIAKQLLTEGIIEKLDAETDKYLARDKEFQEFRLMRTLYDKQRNVFLDNDENKIIIGSRRIGKTELAARLLLKDVIQPNHHAIFIALKFENAIKQCYEIVADLAETLGMGVSKSSKVDGVIEFNNGSTIMFKGNSNKSEALKLQGYKFSCVVVDEIQSQIGVNFLLNDIIKPATADYDHPQIICLGTPPRIPHTYCEKIWNEFKGWKKYSWAMEENPYIRDVEKKIDQLCFERGLTRESPFIQREFYGKMGIYDTEAAVFKDPTLYTEIPNDFIPNRCYIGVDYGATDANGIVALVADTYTKRGFVLLDKKFRDSTVSSICKEILETRNECLNFILSKNSGFDLNKCFVVCDTNEKSISYEISKTYNVPNVVNAYKYDKQMALQQLSEWCRTGVIKIKKDSYCYDEMQQTIYKRDESTDAILPEIDDAVFHPDVLDAFLYLSRLFCYECFNVETTPKAIKNIDNTINPNFNPYKDDEESDDVIWD